MCVLLVGPSVRPTGRPIIETEQCCGSGGSHEPVADNLHIIATARIDEHPHIRQIA